MRREWSSWQPDPDRLWLIVYPGIMSGILVALPFALGFFLGRWIPGLAALCVWGAAVAGAAAAACQWRRVWSGLVRIPVAGSSGCRS